MQTMLQNYNVDPFFHGFTIQGSLTEV